MARVKISRDAAIKAKKYSDDTRDALMANVTVLDNDVNAQFETLRDPSIQKYLEMTEEMQTLLTQIGHKMESVSKYCDHVIAWIDRYNEI